MLRLNCGACRHHGDVRGEQPVSGRRSAHSFQQTMTEAFKQGSFSESEQAIADFFNQYDAFKGLEALWPTMPKDAMEMWFGKGITRF